MSPIYASLGKNGKLVAVPRSILFRQGVEQEQDDGDDGVGQDEAELQKAYIQTFQPTHHMYYADRTMNIPDDLPKYVGTSTPGRGVLWTPKE